MAEQPGGAAAHGPVRPVIALVFATIGFAALAIFGLGMTSLATGEAVIATPGLGQIPGAVAFVCGLLAFAGGLWVALRRRHPSFWGAAWTAAASLVPYVGGLWVAVLATGASLGVATGVAGRFAASWFGVVLAAAAFVSAWSGIALVRTRARRPRWPWEDEFDE